MNLKIDVIANRQGRGARHLRNRPLQGRYPDQWTQDEPFILSKGFRPAKHVYISVDLCNGDNGRLDIRPDGTVVVETKNSFAPAQCLTSLDGAWFARTHRAPEQEERPAMIVSAGSKPRRDGRATRSLFLPARRRTAVTRRPELVITEHRRVRDGRLP